MKTYTSAVVKKKFRYRISAILKIYTLFVFYSYQNLECYPELYIIILNLYMKKIARF